MTTDESIKEFERAATAIIDGQHSVARSDGKGGWVKVEELGVYLEDDGIADVVAALRTAALELVEKEIAVFVAPIGDANPNEHLVDARVRGRLATLRKLKEEA